MFVTSSNAPNCASDELNLMCKANREAKLLAQLIPVGMSTTNPHAMYSLSDTAAVSFCFYNEFGCGTNIVFPFYTRSHGL